MHNKKSECLHEYIDVFRDFINGKISKQPKPNEDFDVFVKRMLKLNSQKDWNFLCSSMDLIGDTTLAIDNFFQFGVDGPTKYNDFGEKYLRLYGVLNSIYIQQEAVYRICKIANLPTQSKHRKSLESLEIRDVRHKLGAHSVDYVDKNSDEIHSFVPVRIELGGLSVSYVNNDDLSMHSINLGKALEEHLDLMMDMLHDVMDKLKKTFYKPNPEKILEVDQILEALSAKRRGAVVHKIDGKYNVLIDFGAPQT